jgi:hypothetical protein
MHTGHGHHGHHCRAASCPHPVRSGSQYARFDVPHSIGLRHPEPHGIKSGHAGYRPSAFLITGFPRDDSSEESVLAVDLDGTLVRTDTLVEAVLSLVRARPMALAAVLAALTRGRAGFKTRVAVLSHAGNDTGPGFPAVEECRTGTVPGTGRHCPGRQWAAASGHVLVDLPEQHRPVITANMWPDALRALRAHYPGWSCLAPPQSHVNGADILIEDHVSVPGLDACRDPDQL